MSVLDTSARNDQVPLPLPENKLPSSWWDEEEIGYLFSPLRSYTQNPSDKENKIKFWKPLIRNWCEHNKRCTFTLTELETAFRRNQLVPACLHSIIEDMLRNHQLDLKDEFMKLPPPTWSGWAVDLLVKKPVGWSLKKVKGLVITSNEAEREYVYLEAVKFLAEILLSSLKTVSKTPLISRNDVEKLEPSTNDLDVVLHWLLREGKMLSRSYKDEEVMKFSTTKEKVSAISQTDLGIYALQQSEKHLSENVEQLEAEILQCMQSAKNYMSKGMKQMAKSSLRKKHALEKCIDKRASVLENVQILLNRIRESHSDAKILETYQHGLAALKNTMKEANLTEDNVANTMLEMDEAFDIHDDIQQALAQPGSTGTTDEDELEAELAKLLLDDAPSVVKEIPLPEEDTMKDAKKAPSPKELSENVCVPSS